MSLVSALVFAVGCGSTGRSREPVKLVDRASTVRLGLIGASFVVDGDALVQSPETISAMLGGVRWATPRLPLNVGAIRVELPD